MRRVSKSIYGVVTDSPEEHDWKRLGTCGAYGCPDLWFPEGKDKRRQEETAVGICRACPMLARCRESALRNKEIDGVWGGLKERELRQLVGKRGVR